MNDPHGPFAGLEIQTDDSLPPEVFLLVGGKGISHATDGDVEMWCVGREQWERMTPEQRAEFS